jgi:hypothetical protein
VAEIAGEFTNRLAMAPVIESWRRAASSRIDRSQASRSFVDARVIRRSCDPSTG